MAGAEPICWREVAQRIRQGDQAAGEALVSFFRARVMMLAAVRLRDTEAAQEIAQETLLVVVKALRDGSVREPEKLPAFVLGVARNLVNNYARAQLRQPDPAPLEPEVASAINLPQEIEEKETSALARAALEGLKPIDRKILLLTLDEGMTPREIAPLLGLSAENVRTRKARAIKVMRERIAKTTQKHVRDHITH